MAQYHPQNQINFLSAGPIVPSHNYEQQEDMGVARPTKRRRNDLGSVVDVLHQATLRTRPGEQPPVRSTQRKNRNEVYALANSILVKEIHLKGMKFSRDIELCRGINNHMNYGDFILVLRLDGRIVVMSDEAEYHLGKSMRSLYSQCINIFECLDKTDCDQLRSILAASEHDQGEEYQLVCTFRLPKGKRPSRINEDTKAINMAGHFYSCHEPSTKDHPEKLFVARCQALVSRTTSDSSLSQADCMHANSHTSVKLKLNDDMVITDLSSNAEDILGYRRHELNSTWFGRILCSDDLSRFENNLKQSFQSEQNQATNLTNICDIFDIYTKNGDGRLTFSYQIRPIRERRTRTVKFLVTAQLIDPSLRNECMKHLNVESNPNRKTIKVEQVNLVSPSVSKTSEDTILANSPSLSGGLLMCDQISQYGDYNQQRSPFYRSLSDVVAPIEFFEQSWPDFYDFGFVQQYPVGENFDYSSSLDQAMDSCFDQYFDPFTMIENEFY